MNLIKQGGNSYHKNNECVDNNTQRRIPTSQLPVLLVYSDSMMTLLHFLQCLALLSVAVLAAHTDVAYAETSELLIL